MRQSETKINRKVEKKKAKEHNTREQPDELKTERRQR